MLADDADDAAGNAQAVRDADGGSRFPPDGPRHLHRQLVPAPSGSVVSTCREGCISPRSESSLADLPGTNLVLSHSALLARRA